MNDAFALLAQPRRPWLDEAALREAYHQAAAKQHPDTRAGNAEVFAGSNAAFATLRDPVKRLRHLLELENPAALQEREAIPSDLVELFPRIAAARGGMLALAARRRAATTAISRALLAGEEAAARAAADEARTGLDAARAAALETLCLVDATWPSAEARAAVPELHRRLSYLSRWDELLREASVQCELG